jgi:hypothetical protein
MQALAVLGGVMVAAGLFGLGYCIRTGFRIRREGGAPEAIRAELHRLVAVNLGSVALAALGLGLLIAGLTLG